MFHASRKRAGEEEGEGERTREERVLFLDGAVFQ
jgi:hypothetical protein